MKSAGKRSVIGLLLALLACSLIIQITACYLQASGKEIWNGIWPELIGTFIDIGIIWAIVEFLKARRIRILKRYMIELFRGYAEVTSMRFVAYMEGEEPKITIPQNQIDKLISDSIEQLKEQVKDPYNDVPSSSLAHLIAIYARSKELQFASLLPIAAGIDESHFKVWNEIVAINEQLSREDDDSKARNLLIALYTKLLEFYDS